MSEVEYAIFSVAIAIMAYGIGHLVGSYKDHEEAYNEGKKDGMDAGIMSERILREANKEEQQ